MFRQCDRGTVYLFPPSVQEWLPEGHLARFIVEIVDQLNLDRFKKDYAGRGSEAYSPEMLVALLFYGYATGVFSSRQLERSTYDSVAFRYVAANSHPDHDTIATYSILVRLKGIIFWAIMPDEHVIRGDTFHFFLGLYLVNRRKMRFAHFLI